MGCGGSKSDSTSQSKTPAQTNNNTNSNPANSSQQQQQNNSTAPPAMATQNNGNNNGAYAAPPVALRPPRDTEEFDQMLQHCITFASDQYQGGRTATQEALTSLVRLCTICGINAEPRGAAARRGGDTSAPDDKQMARTLAVLSELHVLTSTASYKKDGKTVLPSSMFADAAESPRHGRHASDIVGTIAVVGARMLYHADDPPEVMTELMANAVLKTVSAGSSTFYIANDRGELEARVASGTNISSGLELTQKIDIIHPAEGKQSLEYKCFTEGKIATVNAVEDGKPRSTMYVPVKSPDSAVLGVLRVGYCTDKIGNYVEFTNNDEWAVAGLAVYCGLALHLGAMHRRLVQSIQRTASMLGIARTLSDNALSTDDLSRNIIGAAKDLLHAS
eukprot:PhF_6_TR25177/c0_g1_i1/m.34720